MKNLSIPTLSTDSLGNSLFECITLDGLPRKEGVDPREAKLVSAGIICLCLRGEGKIVINDKSFNIEKGDILTILPHTVVKVTSSSEDFIGYVIVANTRFLVGIQMSDVVQSYIYISEHPVLKISEEQTNNIVELGEMLKRKRDVQDHPFTKEISSHLLKVLCYELHAMYMHHKSETNDVAGVRSRQSALCHEFMVLVEKYSNEYRDMGFYADKLCITPKYLSVVVKKTSGISPVEWIDRAVMRSARILLTSSEMTVQQISAELNFPNPSFFGQFFKRHEGTTPKQYRMRNRE